MLWDPFFPEVFGNQSRNRELLIVGIREKDRENLYTEYSHVGLLLLDAEPPTEQYGFSDVKQTL